jgi:repressor LexA
MKNNKQSEILEFVQNKIKTEGYSPSIREIAEAVNLKSTSSVQHHLNNLVKKGIIEKKANLSRSLTSNQNKSNFSSVPVVGFISAGIPLLAEENKIGEIPVPNDKFTKDLFALKINGESMIEAGIHDGDIVVVDKNQEPKNGDIGAFMIHDTEATVKYLDTLSGKKYLIPANKNFENIEVTENTQPIGKVVSLFRDI